MTDPDTFDDEILRILTGEWRITNQAPAARVGLSASVTLRWVQVMERSGLVRGDHAVSRSPDVRECHDVTGAGEHLLRVEVRDLAAYEHVHTEILDVLPQVASQTTYVVMISPKDARI